MRVSDHLTGTDFKGRFAFVSVLVAAFFVLILGRLWYLQIFQGRKFRQYADENRIELRKIPAMRGRVLDRNGVVIADSRASFDLKVTRAYVEKEGKVADAVERLGAILGWDAAERARISAKAASGNAYEPTVIRNDLSRDELARFMVRRYAFPGFDVLLSPARSYPFGDHGSHLLGYLGEIGKTELAQLREKGNTLYDPGDVWGIAGVEKRFDLPLRGRNGSQPIVRDARGREIGVGLAADLLPAFRPREPERGNDLVLAIDARVQEAAEEAFAHESGGLVALDPRNGDVLALLSRPEFSPEKFARGVSSNYWGELTADPLNPLYDRALRGLYPPGSTFKFVTVLAALGENVTHPEETVFCPGSYRLGRETKKCWKKEGHGHVNLHRALRESCDVYFYEMGRRVGIDRLASYAKRLGMGSRTGIGINREEAGLVPTEAWKQRVYRQPWVGGETLSVAIGQGALQITPIQLAVALSALVNGGRVLEPRVALRTQDVAGKPVELYPERLRETAQLSPAHVERVRKGLDAVVNEEGGTAYWSARSKAVLIGGKTGTAQTVGRFALRNRGDHAWFIAYAPVVDPRIVVAVIVEYGGHGGSTAAPIAKKVIEAYLVPPVPEVAG